MLSLPVAASPLGAFGTLTGMIGIAQGVTQVRIRLVGSLAVTARFDTARLYER